MSKPKHITMLKNLASENGIKLGWIAEKIKLESTKFSRIANGVQLPDVHEGQRIVNAFFERGVLTSITELWPLPDESSTERSDT